MTALTSLSKETCAESEAAAEDGVPIQPLHEPLSAGYMRRGRGALALLGLIGFALFFFPWIHVKVPDIFMLSGFQLGRSLGWAVDHVRAALNVTHYEFFALRDADSSNPGLGYQFGLPRDDYRPKPAFDRYRALVAELGV